MAKAQQSANGRATARPGAGKAGRGGRVPAQAAGQSRPGPAKGQGRPAGAGSATGTGGPGGNGTRGNGTRGNGSGGRNASAGGGGAPRASSPARGRDAVRNGDTAPVTAGVPPTPSWLVAATGVLVLAGLGLSVYLTITHLHPAALLCSSHGLVNCEAVTQSSQSKVFGIFPVAELGLAFYVFMAVICSPWAWRMTRVLRVGPVRIGNAELRWIRLASVIVGIGFVLYLVFVELVQLGSICLYCTGVHIATFLLFILILFDFVFRQAPAYSAAPVSAKRTKG
jgi:uncharacterized membrane protein